MSVVTCPSCGQAIQVPEKKSSLPWLIGCLVVPVAIAVVLAVLGILAAIAIPSFVTARSTAQMHACRNNMRQIDAAKEQWALTTGATVGSTVDIARVNAYIKGDATPLCPAQGTYTYHAVGTEPACSVHGSMSAMTSRR
jgi:Tfp pilus assembly protein PilE